MKKFLIAIILVGGIVTSSHAQTFEWAKQFGGPGFEVSSIIATDNQGNVYTLGQFNNTIDLDPGTGVANFTAVFNYDIYLSKIDKDGNFLWAAQFGGNDNEFPTSMAVDHNDNVICSGVFYNGTTIDFDPGPGIHNMTATSTGESFVVKLDSAGNFLWSTQRTGYSGIDRNNGMVTDASGNIYLGGTFLATSDFDPGAGVVNLTSIGSYDAFVQKLDANGNHVWVKQMGGAGGSAVAYGIAIDQGGSILTTGYLSDTIDFNPSMAPADTAFLIGDISGSAFVTKINNSGDFLWASGFRGNDVVIGFEIVTDDMNNVFTAGRFQGTADLDPHPSLMNNISSLSYYNVYISKLDMAGNFSWAGMLGGNTGSTYINGLDIDENNNLYIAGHFESGACDFDPGSGTTNLTPNGQDGFITKMTSAGSFVWAKQIGGVNIQQVTDVAVEPGFGIYYNGSFDGVADCDPDAPVFNLTPVASYDGYVAKLSVPSTAGIYENSENIKLDIYPNPTSQLLNIDIDEEFETIFIYNSLGALVQMEWKKNFSVEHLPSGIYIIQLKTKNGTYSKRFIKE